jgi:hypothetical protein
MTLCGSGERGEKEGEGGEGGVRYRWRSNASFSALFRRNSIHAR